MNKNIALIGAVTAIVAAAVVGLTACSATTPTPDASSAPIGSGVVSPIQIPVAEANGMSYDIPMNSIGYLNVPESTEADWTGTAATPGVVEFTQGGSDGDATLVPGLTPLAPGKTDVTLTNNVTGESVTFTVTVTA
jgi:hypothetical protein